MGSRTVAPDVIRLTDQIGTDLGYHFDGARRRAGLTRAALFRPGLRLTAEQASDYLQAAQSASGRADLGLLVGSRQTVTSWSLLGLAMLSADSLAAAVTTGVRFRSIAGALLDLALETVDGALVLTMVPHDDVARVHRFVCEEAIASIAAMAKVALGPATALAGVEFAFPRPPEAATATGLFGPGVQYDRPVSAIRFPVGLATAPLLTRDPYTHHEVVEILDAQLAARRQLHGTVDQVEEFLRGRLARRPEITDTAARLHLSERTLRRRLADAGTTYQAILDRCRRDHARAMLSTPHASLASIARACGLSDERSLRRALLRWFGQPASALRGRHRDGEAAYEPGQGVGATSPPPATR